MIILTEDYIEYYRVFRTLAIYGWFKFDHAIDMKFFIIIPILISIYVIDDVVNL